jgi:hypothetical protein
MELGRVVQEQCAFKLLLSVGEQEEDQVFNFPQILVE